MRVFHHGASALRRTWRIAAEAPRAGLWTLVALVAAFLAIGLAAITAENLERWTTGPHARTASMVVYLGEAVDDAHARVLTTQLAQLAGVEHAELIAPAESAARLQQALGADPTLLDGIEVASLPASVEVTLAPGVRDVVAMSPTVRALRGTPGVADVVVEPVAEDHAGVALAGVRGVLEVAAGLLAGLALLGALAALRVRLDRAGDELAVARLLGAGPAFTILPTALAGAVQGLAAAALAAGVLWLAVARYGDAVAAALTAALGPIDVIAPALPELALFVAAGAVLGLLGGGLAGAARAAR